MDNHSTLQKPRLKIVSEHETNTTVPDAEEEQAGQLTKKQGSSQVLPEECSTVQLSGTEYCATGTTGLTKVLLKQTHTDLTSFSFPQTYSKPKGNLHFLFPQNSYWRQSSLSVPSIDAS